MFRVLTISLLFLCIFPLYSEAQNPVYTSAVDAFCLANPLALAWDSSALPALLVGSSPDDELRSRVWTLTFEDPSNWQTASPLVIAVQDGVAAVSSTSSGIYPPDILPASLITGAQALAILRSIPGYENAVVLGTTYEYVPLQGSWVIGIAVEINGNHGTVTIEDASTPGDTNPQGCSALASQAAEMAKTLLGAPYGYGGKGYDFLQSFYVDAPTISSGYNYYRADCIQDQFLGLGFHTGVDCSGLVLWSYNTAFGATSKFKDGNPVIYEGSDGQYYNNFQRNVNFSDLAPGDLLFFNYSHRVDGSGNPLADHVAMYVGGDDVLEAYTCVPKYPSGNYVIRSSVTTRSTLDPITGQALQSSCPPNPQNACFLGYRRLTQPNVQFGVHSHSPVTLAVTDPDGYTIDANTVYFTDREALREIPRILYYTEDTDNDDTVISPVLKSGNYIVNVLPKPGTQGTDTYSLSVDAAGTNFTLATNVPISEIPPTGYGVRSQGGIIGSFVPVGIDIRPNNSQNRINRHSAGKVAVAVLSNSSFNAASVNRASLTFGRTGDEQSLASCNHRLKDVNGDGLPDLVCKFYVQAAGFQLGDKVGILNGYTDQNTPFGGQDSVLITGR